MSTLMILILAAMGLTVLAGCGAWTYLTLSRQHGRPGQGSTLPGARRTHQQPWNDKAGRRGNH